MQTKDFKGQDLRGRSFKNQDLTGADFSGCDLRGVDFSFANLTDAKLCNARMGESSKRSIRTNFIGVFNLTLSKITKKDTIVFLKVLKVLLSSIAMFFIFAANVFIWFLGAKSFEIFNIKNIDSIYFFIGYSVLIFCFLLTIFNYHRYIYMDIILKLMATFLGFMTAIGYAVTKSFYSMFELAFISFGLIIDLSN